MDKTVVSFEKDITAVVGPNGCGKSNIVDAIRWVMGEQSAKHLRGKNMEDVIFNGSETRTALSMASVELTFSTEGYQTPAAHLNQKEISIGRKLFRTGESEYYINKTPARLKDITDLFLGTGIGTKAYSVIEQGRISEIVTAKPEDRRYYIEEVAGISKFKSRKEAALRKMEATRQNLLRLNDITTELDRQLKSLDRQAKKAQKYKEIRDEFRKWDLSLSAHLYKGYSQSQNKFEGELRSFDEDEKNLLTQLQEAENLLESKKVVLIEQESGIQTAQNILFEQTNLIRLAEASMSFKKEERERLLQSVVSGDQELISMEDQLANLAEKLTHLNEERALSDLDGAGLDEAVLGLDSNVAEMKIRLDELTKSLNELRSESHRTQNRQVQIETLKNGLNQKREDLTTRLNREEQDLSEAEKNYRKLDREYRETSDNLSGLKQMKMDLNLKADELLAQLNQSSELLKIEEVSLAQLKEDLTLKRSRLTSLEELERNFEGYQEGTRSVLFKKDEISAGGIFGTVADCIETDNEYEGAVSAVLGEKLQFVVVKSQQEGMQAIDYLRVAATGRSSFVPMEVTGSIPDETPASGDGVLGHLSQFVRVKSGFESMSRFLFGDAVLVGDLNQALHNWADKKRTYVTMAGEVVDRSGVITGGSLAQTSVALLEKKREIKDLKIILEKLNAEHGEKLVWHKSLVQKTQDLSGLLESLKNSSVAEEIRISSQETDMSHLKRNLDGLVAEQKELKERIEKEQGILAGIQPEFDRLCEEENILKENLAQATQSIEANEIESSSLRSTYEEKASILGAQKLERAKNNERQKSLENEMNRLLQEKSALRMKLAKKEQQVDVNEWRTELIETDLQHLRKYLDIKLEKKNQHEGVLSGLKSEYDALAHGIRQEEGSIRDLRRHHQEASQRVNKITLELSETRGHLKALAEQVLERHQEGISDIWESYFDAELDLTQAHEQVRELKDRLHKLGEVNTAALEEFDQTKQRFDFLMQQKNDLEESLASLERVINKINRTTRDRFFETFNAVNEKFQQVFPHLFHGGKAKLVLTDENNLLETGVEIVAQPPGKKLQSISLLSGGEKALTAVSLIFAIFQIKPSPFCILDEVDAPLDDVNVGRYNEMIRDMTNRTQFIVITHNKKTMEMGDVMYGVTMQEPGISQLVSVALN